jgi:hypothetical protein
MIAHGAAFRSQEKMESGAMDASSGRKFKRMDGVTVIGCQQGATVQLMYHDNGEVRNKQMQAGMHGLRFACDDGLPSIG